MPRAGHRGTSSTERKQNTLSPEDEPRVVPLTDARIPHCYRMASYSMGVNRPRRVLSAAAVVGAFDPGDDSPWDGSMPAQRTRCGILLIVSVGSVDRPSRSVAQPFGG